MTGKWPTILKERNNRLTKKPASAFVTFFQRQEMLETNTVTESYEERYMERINGKWKIVNITVWNLPKK